MSRVRSSALVLLALFLAPHASPLHAQWVAAARAARNRVQHMTQKSAAGGYDVATVLLEAAPSAVYDKTLKSLQAHPEIKITKNDKTAGRIEISKGQLLAGFQITALGDKLTQLVIAASIVPDAAEGPTSLVVDSVLRVCKEVDVKCTVEQN